MTWRRDMIGIYTRRPPRHGFGRPTDIRRASAVSLRIPSIYQQQTRL